MGAVNCPEGKDTPQPVTATAQRSTSPHLQRAPYDGGDPPASRPGPVCNPVASAEPRGLWERQSVSQPFTLFDKEFATPPIPLEYTTLTFRGGAKLHGSMNAALEAATLTGVTLDTCKEVNPNGIIDKPKERGFFDPLNPKGLFWFPMLNLFDDRALVGRGHLEVPATAGFTLGFDGKLGVDADLPIVPIPHTGATAEIGLSATGTLAGTAALKMDVEFVAQGSQTYVRFVAPLPLTLTASGSLALWAKFGLQALGYEVVTWQPRWEKALTHDLFSAELLFHYPFDHEYPNSTGTGVMPAGNPGPPPVTNAVKAPGLVDMLGRSPDFHHGNHGTKSLGFTIRTARDALNELLQSGTLTGDQPNPYDKRADSRQAGRPGGPGPARPTGRTESDPIPIRWRKGMSKYPETLKLEVDGEYNDSGRDSKGRFVEPRKYKTFRMDRAGQRLIYNDAEYTIGVSKAYLPAPGKIVRVTDNDSRSQSSTFRDKIMKPNDLAGRYLGQPDHVQDLIFEGPDHFSNLWPMYSPVNMGAGSTNSKQQVEYCADETSPPTKSGVNKLVGRYVIIDAVDP